MMKDERLTQLENEIHRNRRSFYDIGRALKEIRDEKLYRHLLYESFEKYTLARWEIGKSQAYRLIDACNVLDNLSPIGDTLPENESQVRPLAPLDPAEQRKLWRSFLKTGKLLSTQNIRNFISETTGLNQKKRPDLTDRISEHYKAVTHKMLEQISLAKSEEWRSTSQEAALFWNQVMKEKILTSKT